MRWTWRCRMCAVGWVVGVYMCAVGLITLINMTDPSIQRAYAKLNQATSAGSNWGWSNRRTGRGARLPWCNTLRFRQPPGPNTALTSFPGSGNTWLRYLLQQSTGYYTGSVYKDYALMKNGFPAESINNGSVVVVKTHELGSQVHKGFFRAILILRDPYQAIQAEFNRQSGGHIGHAQPEKYTRNHGKYWEDFVTSKAIAWMNTALDWLKFVGPLHLVFYEDLIDNLPEEMRRILEFLEVDVDEKSFDCMIRHKDGIYKRRHKAMGFDPYTPKLRAIVERCKAVVDKAAKEFLAGGDIKMVLATMNDTVATASNPHAGGGADGGEGVVVDPRDRKGRAELLKSSADSSR